MKKKIVGGLIGIVVILIIVVCIMMVYANKNMVKPSIANQNITGQNITTSSNFSDYTFDFSEYSNHGIFTEDGIAWVCKENYYGKQFGYINKENEYIIPLSDQIVAKNGNSLSDYENGMVVVFTKDKKFSIYDTEGNVIISYSTDDYNNLSVKYLNNGNILLTRPNNTKSYMYVKSKNIITEQETEPITSTVSEYSEGLLYCGDLYGVYDGITSYNSRGVKFFDEEGELVLKLPSGKNTEEDRAYDIVLQATDFKDGKSTILFIGQDKNWYTVEINKNGEWLGEPIQIEKDANIRKN